MEIHLDCPNRGYLPGALVRGEVEVDQGTDGEQGTLSIVFSGRSMIELKSWSVGPGDYSRNTQFLMISRITLYEGVSCYTDMPAGGYPFLFTFSSKTQNALGQSIWPESAKYGSPKSWGRHAALESLPPSLSFTGGSILSATIEYRLDVKWVSGTRQERRSCVLPFDTYRSEPSPHITSVTTTDSFSFRNTPLPYGEDNSCPLTVSDRFHLALRSEGTGTKVKFNIKTTIGTTVVQGEVPSVELCLYHLNQKAKLEDIPVVRLQVFTVHLERITAARTPRRAASHTNTVHFSFQYEISGLGSSRKEPVWISVMLWAWKPRIFPTTFTHSIFVEHLK
ncbi:hypothetical protein N7509_011916 [Penicillium cosmopolitanum]|uniref:Arrestin-like N-terminal domain-containing protein n=1 Tax=Penicillium cosmopolitanum TaxID=1131564 RepID=A0A9W9SIH9_9EURO|nr:uncharacterized protein N7509_011916 [Penicillium cosmopolitanum]KAJ5378797.1 hypothetical protein N7509_011916 [Penicillium cosmopolitanum]